jgi:hypothetical protein
MSRRLHPSWLVLASLENQEHTRCVDLFRRPDGTHGFEEFRRDPEDAGAWTPVAYFSAATYDTHEQARAAAARVVAWLAA